MATLKHEQIWLMSHAYTCTLLRMYRDRGFWFTSNQSWNLMKWNACGNVLISRRAIEHFFLDPSLHKCSKAKNFGGRGNARCFVAEHMYPTKALQELILTEWQNCDPSLDEFSTLMKKFNRICYVWYEENECLEQSSYKSSLPKETDRHDLTARYRATGIEACETHFPEGNRLFTQLERLRHENRAIDSVMKDIAQCL